MSRLLALVLLAASAVMPQSNNQTTQLHALFGEDWQWRLQNYPESATMLGDNRFNDRLTDYSFEAIESRKAHEREMLNRIRRLDRSRLRGQDVISYDLFLRDKELEVEGQRYPAELIPITQMDGVHLGFAKLIAATPMRNAKDYEDCVKRLSAFATQLDQIIALMQRGIERRWVPPAVPLRSLPAQIAGQITDDPEKSPLFDPFRRFTQEVAAADRARLTDQAKRTISSSVMPAMKRLHSFVEKTWLPAAPADIAVKSFPDGPDYYRYSARVMTTTGLAPEEIHEIGKREVARIRGEMERIIKQVDFNGSFSEFLTFLRTDPRFYYTRAEDLVAGYRDICKRADMELPRLFAELPRNPYGVREMPDYEAPAQTTARYQSGAADGSRAGVYWVNTFKLEARPKYEMEALSLHEAVPGHHLQISRAQELQGLPEFRRHGGYTAFVEGWALYAESLGEEMGFYTDPYSRFGQLTYEMWRACRLVVDTGMHMLGWSRQQAIDYMKSNTAKTENDIIVEIDRYIVWPAQALAYKLGELKIKELRAKAQAELGERFDVRRFHNAVLDDGPLPLDLLEKRLGEWIAEQKETK